MHALCGGHDSLLVQEDTVSQRVSDLSESDGLCFRAWAQHAHAGITPEDGEQRVLLLALVHRYP